MGKSELLTHYTDAMDLMTEGVLIAGIPSTGWTTDEGGGAEEHQQDAVVLEIHFMNAQLRNQLGYTTKDNHNHKQEAEEQKNMMKGIQEEGVAKGIKCVDGVWFCKVVLMNINVESVEFYAEGKIKQAEGVAILKLRHDPLDELTILRQFFSIDVFMTVVELGPDNGEYEWRHVFPNRHAIAHCKSSAEKLATFSAKERQPNYERKAFYEKCLELKRATLLNDEHAGLLLGTTAKYLGKHPFTNNDLFAVAVWDSDFCVATKRTNLLGEFFENAPLMMGAVQLDKGAVSFCYANPATAEYMECSQEDLIGKVYTTYEHRESYEAVVALYKKSRESNQIVTKVMYLPGPNNQVHYVQATVSTINYDPVSDISLHTYIMTDLTKQKQIELELETHKSTLEEMVRVRTLELQEKEKTFGSLVANAPNIILGINRQGVIDDTTVLLGRLLQSLVVEGPELMEKITVLFETSNKSLKMDVKLLDSDVWLNLSAGAIDETSAIIVATDVTEMKQLSDKLQHALATKSRFLANMSHEVRTPLSGIIGMSRILMESGNLSMDQCECVATIQYCGETLLAVINDVLDFTKLEACGETMAVESNELSLHQCLEESIYTIIPAAQKKKLELIIEIDPQIPDRILGDMLRLRQVVVNLLNNAIKFTDTGYIHLTLTGTEIYGTDEWKYCCTVKDTGCGVPQESQGKLFHMFSQVDISTTRKYGGTGIGLALAKRFLEMMGGEISMYSSGVPGEGSSFSFSLTATLAPFTPAISPSSIPPPRLLVSSTHIFVVKAINPLSSEVLRRRLMGKGLASTQISTTTDVAETFKKIEDLMTSSSEMKNVLVFCDLEQITPCQKYPLLDYPNVVLVLMGYTRPKNFDTEYPPHEFLRKPIKHTSLLRALKEAWSRFDNNKHIPTVVRVPSAKQQLLHYPLNILVVEDNEMNQRVVKRVFQHLGYSPNEILIANHGMEALEMIEKNGIPDLILMDIQMPVLDGVQTTKIIRQKYSSNWPFIVSMTADAFPEDRKNCLDAGMNDFLTKPIRVEQVHNTLQKCFKLKEQKDRSSSY